MIKNNTAPVMWEKPRKPMVTECCASLNFVITQSGTFCYECNNLSPNHVRQATAEDMRKNGLSYSDEEFNSAYK